MQLSQKCIPILGQNVLLKSLLHKWDRLFQSQKAYDISTMEVFVEALDMPYIGPLFKPYESEEG